jgi:hypothetical protein
LELLSYARNRLKCKPQLVLFDSWYPSKAWLERIGDYSGYFVCRLKKNRGFEGTPLYKYLRQLDLRQWVFCRERSRYVW